jgi:8-oxo-dGTP pyrophosphatase MutT (NUDIX family)
MYLEKVTAFVLRPGELGRELLLFKHPTAGYQLPAGTVEAGEQPESAVLREVLEETGLAAKVARKLGVDERDAPPGSAYLRSSVLPVRFAPREEAILPGDALPRCLVNLGERKEGFVHVHYQEFNLSLQPPPLLWEVRSWVPENEIAGGTRRHFFEVEPLQESPPAWDQLADLGHTFHLFWARVGQLPTLIGEQNDWLRWLS